MSLIDGLKIFKSDGSPLNSKISGNSKIFYLNMKKTSVGLIEHETLYLLEEVASGNHENPIFNTSVTFSKDDDRFDTFVVVDDTLIFENPSAVLSQNVQTGISYDTNGKRTSMFDVSPVKLNVAFKSEEDGYFDCRFVMKTSDCEIVIELYCEAEDQDERLINLLARFGEILDISDEKIFVEKNINEDLSSSILMNNKRKELLNYYGELAPYFPTILGLKTIIHFFGYAEILAIREYYFNNQIGKFEARELNDKKYDKNIVQKLNEFGLYFSINKVVENEYDEFGDPLLIDVLPFPYEEIAIKLFGLKNFIEKRDIGGATKIVDIIGEKINFSRLRLRTWKNHNTYLPLLKTKYPEIDILYQDKYIVDLRIYDNFVCSYDPDANINSEQVYLLNQCYISHFATLYRDNPYLYDEPELAVGSKIILRNATFDISWNDADVSWFQNNLPQDMTWLNVGGINYHKAVWQITGDRGYVNIVETDTNSVDTIEFIVPYSGKYTVVLKLIGFDGIISKKTFKDLFVVEMKQAEFMSFWKAFEPELQIWETNNLSWNQTFSPWNAIIYENTQFIIDDGEITFETFNIVNFMGFQTKFGFGNLSWVDLEEYFVSWNNLKNLSWVDSEYEIRKLPNAIISEFHAGDKFLLNDQVIIIPNNINNYNFTALAEYLNSISFGEYLFTARKDYLDQPFMEIIRTNVGVAGDFYICSRSPISFEAEYDLNSWSSFVQGIGLWGSWNELTMPWRECENMYRSKSSDEEFDTNNVRFFDNEFTAPRFIPIFFTLDKSDVRGKTKGTCKIYKDDGEQIAHLEGLHSVFRFFETGLYSVEYEVEDTNGNTQKIHKNNIIKIVEHEQY